MGVMSPDTTNSQDSFGYGAGEYRPTIGLEIHAELKTRTKMFCESKNDPDETRPNVNVCPVCMAHPGTLPTINKQAVSHVRKVGIALGGTLSDFSEFDRKSYFYPDIPKGYQISQYEHPLVSGGSLNGVAVTRVHLEEDTARSIHTPEGSLVDFNRAGVPLMELVTEPVIHDAKTAGDFARELQLLLRTLDVGEANLEKGEMRIEANVSVSNSDEFGTKVEIKNLNSFRSVERAIAYEVERQIACYERGEKVFQETRGWNEATGETFHQRYKEGSADYRYFPDPDLPKMKLEEVEGLSRDTLQATLVELPSARRTRYETDYGLTNVESQFIVQDSTRIHTFEKIVALLTAKEEIRTAVNYFVSDLAGVLGNCALEEYISLIRMIHSSRISSRAGKEVLTELKEKGGSAEDLVKTRGLEQVSDTKVLEEAVGRVLTNNESVVAEYKAGKKTVIQYLVGQGMKESKGAGNPSVIREILEQKLG